MAPCPAPAQRLTQALNGAFYSLLPHYPILTVFPHSFAIEFPRPCPAALLWPYCAAEFLPARTPRPPLRGVRVWTVERGRKEGILTARWRHCTEEDEEEGEGMVWQQNRSGCEKRCSGACCCTRPESEWQRDPGPGL